MRRQFTDWLHGLPGWSIVLVLTVLVLIVGMFLTILFWDWLSTGESNSAVIRNVGLVLAGAIALIFAMWRGLVAERQANAARRQALSVQRQTATARRQTNAVRRQANTAQHDLLNRRYQQGAEMLGSGALSVRLGGIYALQKLAEEHPKEYHVQILKLLCAFVRHPAVGDLEIFAKRPYEAIQVAMEAISSCHKHTLRLINIEGNDQSSLDFSGADIQRISLYHGSFYFADMFKANLSHSCLHGVDLHSASSQETNFQYSDLSAANLSDAYLSGANLHSANLSNANLSNTSFSDDGDDPAMGLTQEQLDQAWAAPEYPPRLDGVLDANTGEPLIWSGRTAPLKAPEERP